MKKRFCKLAIAALLSTAVVASCQQSAVPTKADDPHLKLTQLRALAEKSCHCRMAGRNTVAIDRAFDKLSAGLTGLPFGTSSVPMTGSTIFFEELDGFVGHQITMTSGPDTAFVCTSEEAREVEKTYRDELTGRGGVKGAEAALRKRIEAMHLAFANRLTQSACDLP